MSNKVVISLDSESVMTNIPPSKPLYGKSILIDMLDGKRFRVPNSLIKFGESPEIEVWPDFEFKSVDDSSISYRGQEFAEQYELEFEVEQD